MSLGQCMRIEFVRALVRFESQIPLKHLCMCPSFQKLINYLDNLYVCMATDHMVYTECCIKTSMFRENVVKAKLHFIRSSGTP